MIKGFILAAGFSKRLRPITNYIPKPLMPIAGEVLLDYIYNFLRCNSIDRIGINLHYKAREIENYIKKRRIPIEIFYEKEILDTAGALYNAKNFLKDSIFIVHNADIYWDGNLIEAIKWHKNLKNHITLLVHNYAPENKLIVDNQGKLLEIVNSDKKMRANFAFTGVAIYSSEILKLIPPGSSSIIDLWIKAKSEGYEVRVFPVKYSFWHDIGTPLKYARAVFEKIRRNFTSFYAHPSSKGCCLLEVSGPVVMEKNVKISIPIQVKNVIFLPEVEISASQSNFSQLKFSDCIVGKDFTIPIKKIRKNNDTIACGGSSRSYYRKHKKIYCIYQELNEEFQKTIILNDFFKKISFPVPKIYEVREKYIVFEDLGDVTLYSWMQCKRKKEEILQVYKRILEEVFKLHWKITPFLNNLPISLPQFNFEYFLWESQYFLKECVKGVFHINISKFGRNWQKRLKEELHYIAEKLAQADKVLLHRDLQSQNIMIKKGKIYFLDYQSARLGPAEYDLASLIWDPYIMLSNELRKELVDFYMEKMLKISDQIFQRPLFLQKLNLCKIQRHMQALGAYGFLSNCKGKKNFSKFIPSAVKLLDEDLSECSEELNNLRELISQLHSIVSKKIIPININLD